MDVYTYHDGQDPTYSIYGPDDTFEIKGAAGTSSNPLARYWHAFNLVRVGGKYKIEEVKEMVGATLTTRESGTIETRNTIATSVVLQPQRQRLKHKVKKKKAVNKYKKSVNS